MNAETPTVPATPGVTQDDLHDAARSTAMLADISIGKWSGEISDPGMLNEIKRQAGASGHVGRASKFMLAGADAQLKECHSAYDACRLQHYALTLPWVSDPHATRQAGPRLLPNALFDRYVGEMGRRKRTALAALDAFLDGYPDAVLKARANLGKLADNIRYPTAEELRPQFRVSLEFAPVPDGHGFRGLPDATLSKLAAGLARRQEAQLAAAQAAMWAEVRDRVGKLAERLSNPEHKFQASTVEAVAELPALVAAWNVAGDPRVAEIERDVARLIGGVDAKTLREKATVRADVADQASAVVDKLASWGL